MIRSIRRFLLVSLFISITIASSITAIGNYLLDKRVIQPYLDEKLVKFFNIVEALNQSVNISKNIEKEVEAHLSEIEPSSPQHLLFQVWNKEGNLLFHSSAVLASALKDVPIGFSDKFIDGDDSVSYTHLTLPTIYSV